MKTKNQVIEFVQENAQFYPQNPNNMKYMVKIGSRAVGAPDTDKLVEKICIKLNISPT